MHRPLSHILQAERLANYVMSLGRKLTANAESIAAGY